MKNRLISILLSIALLIVCLPQLALPASAAETSGKCGENLTWSFDEGTGTLTISGSGDMDDYSPVGNSEQHAPWHAFCEDVRFLQLPDGLTSIGGYAFAWCENLARVTIPNSVTRIGSCAFSWCHSLTELAVPDSVTEIGSDAFSYCDDLERVTLPEGVSCGGYVGDNFDILFCPKKDGTYQFYYEGYDNKDDGFACNMFLFDSDGNTVFNSLNPSVCSVDACTANVWLNGGEEYRVSLFHGGTAMILDTYWHFSVRFLAPEKVFRFEDVPETAFYADSVGWALVKDVTNGVDETHFAPAQGCTRAQVVTFLWRASGCPGLYNARNPFTDVKTDAFYYKPMLWAVEQGITNGTSATTFSPDAVCTRAQIVTFLWRARGSSRAVTGKNPFADVSKTGFYYPAMLWAAETGVTTGTGKTAFSPNDTCTRGQVVTFLARAFTERGFPPFPLANYEIVESRATWDEAMEYARSKGGKLVSFESPEEFRFVLERIDAEGPWDNTYYCLGARREPDGSDYYWTDAEGHLIGEPLNAPGAWCADCWQDGEPNLRWNGREETVVMMFYDKAEARWCWYDASPTARTASRNYAYIIEYR